MEVWKVFFPFLVMIFVQSSILGGSSLNFHGPSFAKFPIKKADFSARTKVSEQILSQKTPVCRQETSSKASFKTEVLNRSCQQDIDGISRTKHSMYGVFT